MVPGVYAAVVGTRTLVVLGVADPAVVALGRRIRRAVVVGLGAPPFVRDAATDKDRDAGDPGDDLLASIGSPSTGALLVERRASEPPRLDRCRGLADVTPPCRSVTRVPVPAVVRPERPIAIRAGRCVRLRGSCATVAAPRHGSTTLRPSRNRDQAARYRGRDEGEFGLRSAGLPSPCPARSDPLRRPRAQEGPQVGRAAPGQAQTAAELRVRPGGDAGAPPCRGRRRRRRVARARPARIRVRSLPPRAAPLAEPWGTDPFRAMR